MKSVMKYSLAVPAFAAVLLVAVAAFPAQEQEADAYARSVLIHIASDEGHRVMMGVQHAAAMLDSGKNVAILLDVDGVRAGAGQPEQALQPASQMMGDFMSSGGRVIACEHCIAMAGMSPGDLLPGIEIDSHPRMPKMQRLIDAGAVILDY